MACAVTTQGETLERKFFDRKGPSGWYSHAWISRADQSLSRQKPPTLSQASPINTDFHKGLSVEAELFGDLMKSEAAKALQYAFFGERIVSRIPGADKSVKPRSIATVGIVGGGLMGSGIAIAMLNAGLKVTLVELREEALAKAGAGIRKTIERDVERGRVSSEVAALSL